MGKFSFRADDEEIESYEREAEENGFESKSDALRHAMKVQRALGFKDADDVEKMLGQSDQSFENNFMQVREHVIRGSYEEALDYIDETYEKEDHRRLALQEYVADRRDLGNR